ncbi:MAG: hypothetical protein ACRENE_24860 [Polyangiaceae bacterium]
MRGPLSESAFAERVEAGCPTCKGKKLAIEAFLQEKVPLLGGEVYGSPSWAYKGEDFVRGTYRIECVGCKGELFSASACPRCGSEDGVSRALEATSALQLPRACERCNGEQLTATAFVVARVVYEGKRVDKPRAQAAPEEAGFHAFRTECKRCQHVVETRVPCPVCGGEAGAT